MWFSVSKILKFACEFHGCFFCGRYGDEHLVAHDVHSLIPDLPVIVWIWYSKQFFAYQRNQMLYSPALLLNISANGDDLLSNFTDAYFCSLSDLSK